MKDSWFVHDYDQIRTDENRFEILDLAIPAFLGAHPNFLKMRKGLVMGAPALADRLKSLEAVMREIPNRKDLWAIDEHLIRTVFARLYELASEIPQYRSARATKLLHRKRPQAIPIIDSYTVAAWHRPDWRWVGPREMTTITLRMREELGGRRNSRKATRLVAKEVCPAVAELSDLRLYDILCYQWSYEQARR